MYNMQIENTLHRALCSQKYTTSKHGEYSSGTLPSSFKHIKFVRACITNGRGREISRVMLSRRTCVFDRLYNFVFNYITCGGSWSCFVVASQFHNWEAQVVDVMRRKYKKVRVSSFDQYTHTNKNHEWSQVTRLTAKLWAPGKSI